MKQSHNWRNTKGGSIASGASYWQLLTDCNECTEVLTYIIGQCNCAVDEKIVSCVCCQKMWVLVDQAVV